ncbi:transcriptional regulator GcvA [Pseudoduganella namucuonensis]|uniref:Transcriptional regulator, LysR family n=1 Tax=Pseudoduganella namucuonensis TaxID=1035707 RepID=A0A1I7G436_9BURK|nr:transcriptional regulator GcvA [Pseudoduganella namucuonensis]SFU43153.1 transcriptional regulator, LysR family [Pseudoduganella namucuonensis]
MKLPNFSALRAFEAAARHQNFSRAADELHLTHGAISHQVRALEEELGTRLFVRNGRHVTVTADGLRFAQVLGKAFADIAAGADALRPDHGCQRLSISAIPSFAARWLAPRLGRFIDLHPGVEVLLQASGHLEDLERAAIDIGIRFGRGRYPGLVAQRLMGDIYYPAVSPSYRGGALPRTPAELAQATLLRSNEPWTPWFRAAGLRLPEPSGGVMYEDLSMLIRSAVDGDGVALVRHVVAMQEIASGQLVRLFDVATPSPDDYYFVSPPAAADKPQVRAFRTWMLAEIAQFERELRLG